jgi:hypothetical protein
VIFRRELDRSSTTAYIDSGWQQLRMPSSRLQIGMDSEMPEGDIRQITIEIAGLTFAITATRFQKLRIPSERVGDDMFRA